MIELKCRKNSSLKVQVRSVPLIKQKRKQTKKTKKGKEKRKTGNELASKNPPLDVAFQHHLPCKYHLRQKSLHKDRQGTQLYITIFYNSLFAEEQITGDACGVTLSDLFEIHAYLHISTFKSYSLAGLR